MFSPTAYNIPCVVINHKMKKTYKKLIITAVIIALLSLIVWWQFGNIKTLYYWLRYSQSDIDLMMEKTFEEVEVYLEQNPNIVVRPAEPIEEELHKKGVINDEELTNLLTDKTTVKEIFGTDLELREDKSFENTENGQKVEVEDLNNLKQEASTEKETSSAPSDTDAQISECVAHMYVLKSSFVSRLDTIYNTAFSEYKELWPDMTEEERSAKKKSLLSEVYPQAVALETQCDTEVEKVVSKLKSLLKEAGQNTDLADKIYESYKNEKSLKKAHYLNLITK